jgi:hypothetical protein
MEWPICGSSAAWPGERTARIATSTCWPTFQRGWDCAGWDALPKASRPWSVPASIWCPLGNSGPASGDGRNATWWPCELPRRGTARRYPSVTGDLAELDLGDAGLGYGYSPLGAGATLRECHPSLTAVTAGDAGRFCVPIDAPVQLHSGLGAPAARASPALSIPPPALSHRAPPFAAWPTASFRTACLNRLGTGLATTMEA